jgi:hypothetical protein
MARAKACYFTLTYGLQGCYMPDSHMGPYVAHTRREIVEAVRDALAFYEAPKVAIKQVSWNRLWSQAKRHGTSSIHFCIATSKHNMLEFHGLTEEEYNAHLSWNE